MYLKWLKKGIIIEFILCMCIIGFFIQGRLKENITSLEVTGDFIKWVDFKASYEALNTAYQIDVETYGSKVHLNWIELLAYVATRNGGEFKKDATKELYALKEKLCKKETTLQELTKDMKYYSYYLEAYQAILSEYVGEYEIETKDELGKVSYEKKYGLKAFSPVAKGFDYCDYDDFGCSRSFGYRREHLGHDMMGQIGTPINIKNQPRTKIL